MPLVSREYLNYLNPDARRQFERRHLKLGYHPTSHDAFMVPESARYSGTYITGIPGSGKSGLLKNMVYEDAIRGNAAVLVDAHNYVRLPAGRCDEAADAASSERPDRQAVLAVTV